ncbi:MAG: hypothetical protein M3389_15765 [Actinomycetota bacterium]|nr:hypothetical protein [Actinomycetota bacterium]
MRARYALAHDLGMNLEQEPQRVLVAGVGGVLGRRLVPALVAEGHSVLRPDSLDPGAVVAAVRASRPTVVVHAATAIPVTCRLMAAAERYGVQRVVALSLAADVDAAAAVEDVVMSARQVQGVVLRCGPRVGVDRAIRAALDAVAHGWGVVDLAGDGPARALPNGFARRVESPRGGAR